MKVAVTGTSGRLGRAVADRCEARGWTVLRPGRAGLDLAWPDERLAAALAALDFDCLVHPAAITSLEAAEDDPALAMQVNARAAGTLAEACRRRAARMIFISTDYVFAGTREGLRHETDPTGPLSVYGRSKLAGEAAVLQACPAALVMRVSWLFGPEKPAFPENVLARARRGEALAAVADKWSLPTFTGDLAGWIVRLLPRPDATGIVHACQGGPPASWRDWALATLELACEAGLLATVPEVAAGTLATQPGLRAARPVHSAMATTRLAAWLGEAPRPWRQALREHLLALAAAQACDRPSQTR